MSACERLLDVGSLWSLPYRRVAGPGLPLFFMRSWVISFICVNAALLFSGYDDDLVER